MRHSAKKSTCDTQLFSRSHPRTPRGGWCEHWRALWGSFGAVSVGYAPTPFHGNPREGKGVNPVSELGSTFTSVHDLGLSEHLLTHLS